MPFGSTKFIPSTTSLNGESLLNIFKKVYPSDEVKTITWSNVQSGVE
jgi:hypothetical protein